MASFDAIAKYTNKEQIYLALKYSLVAEEDFLEYLRKKNVTLKHLIAYRHFLLHRIERGKEGKSGYSFILNLASEYNLLYALMGLPLDKLGIPSLQIGQLLAMGTIKLYTDEDFSLFMRIITGREKPKTTLELNWALSSRQYNQLIGAEITSTKLIHHHSLDLIQQIPINSTFLTEFLEYCLKIQLEQPELWIHLSLDYLDLFKDLYLQDRISYYPSLHHGLCELFPALFPVHYKTFTDLAWQIYHLSPIKAGYYLGFPIDLRIPSRADLTPALLELSRYGPKAYSKRYRKENKKYLKTRINLNNTWSLFQHHDNVCVNEIDTFHESVFSYSSYDLLILPDGDGRNFILTAAELNRFLESGRNHWTNRDLPSNFLATARHYLVERERYQLPTPKPLLELLQDLEGESEAHPFSHRYPEPDKGVI